MKPCTVCGKTADESPRSFSKIYPPYSKVERLREHSACRKCEDERKREHRLKKRRQRDQIRGTVS